MGIHNKKTNTTIKHTAALRVNRTRTVAARALDAVRQAKVVHIKPPKKWARHPNKSDVRGIDDGSKRAKARNAGAIKQHFGTIGRQGAYHTNAKNAHRKLQEHTAHIKTIKTELAKPGISDDRRQSLRKKLDVNRRQAIRQQQIAVKWQKPL